MDLGFCFWELICDAKALFLSFFACIRKSGCEMRGFSGVDRCLCSFLMWAFEVVFLQKKRGLSGVFGQKTSEKCDFFKKKVENVLQLKKKPYICTRFTIVTAPQ